MEVTLVANYQYKRDLKGAIGKRLSYTETSLFGAEYVKDGKVIVVGPTAHNRKWYAEVTMRNGLIEEVK